MPVFVPSFPQIEKFPRLPEKGAPLAEMAELCSGLIENFGQTIDLCGDPKAVREALLQGTSGARVWAYHTVRKAFRARRDERIAQYWATYEEQRQLAMDSPMSALIPREQQEILAATLPEAGMSGALRHALGDAIRAVRSWELQAEQAEKPARRHEPSRAPVTNQGCSGRVRRGEKPQVLATA